MEDNLADLWLVWVNGHQAWCIAVLLCVQTMKRATGILFNLR